MNDLEKVFAAKLTENGDKAFNTTGKELLDILFMTSYFEKNLDEVRIGSSNKEKLFSMFIRDPRYGLGRRDLGRKLMELSGCKFAAKVLAGRFDDVITEDITDEELLLLKQELDNNNELAKKWMPRLTGKNKKLAKTLCKRLRISEKEYRKLIKVETTESKLSENRISDIEYSKVSSLAFMKYLKAFKTKDAERFGTFMDRVKSGEEKVNLATTNVYDVYRNREKLGTDVDTIFDKIDKIEISCIPIVDTSGSMEDGYDSYGKAVSIGHYLGKCSTYAPDFVVGFSRNPRLIKLPDNGYLNQIRAMHTGEVADTNFAKVLDMLSNLGSFPDYFVVLSDMEFNEGASESKDRVMELFKERGCNTKIIWWNFGTRNKTVPELDEYGNIFISGYSPMMLKYLEVGFDAEMFLDKLLEEYKKNISK